MCKSKTTSNFHDLTSDSHVSDLIPANDALETLRQRKHEEEEVTFNNEMEMLPCAISARLQAEFHMNCLDCTASVSLNPHSAAAAAKVKVVVVLVLHVLIGGATTSSSSTCVCSISSSSCNETAAEILKKRNRAGSNKKSANKL